MIRDRLRRWVHEASTALEEEQDSSQVQVYTAPWIVPGSAAPIRDGAVAFSRHGQVLACGPREDVVEAFSWARRADLDGILLPGLINAHAHLELSGAREDIKDGIGLSRWLRKLRDLRTETEALDPHSREAHIRGGVRRSVDSGTAAVGEVSDTLRAVPAMAREGLYGAVFHEILGFSARRAAKALAASSRGPRASATSSHPTRLTPPPEPSSASCAPERSIRAPSLPSDWPSTSRNGT